jgi:hypothetical protein
MLMAINWPAFIFPEISFPMYGLMETGYQPEEEGALFGLRYVFVKHPHPYDTTILNYNWQDLGYQGFFLYAERKGLSQKSVRGKRAFYTALHETKWVTNTMSFRLSIHVHSR